MVVHVLASKSSSDMQQAKDQRLDMPHSPPAHGWTKLNIDGSYINETTAADGGMVLRGDTGSIIFTACRQITTCDDGLEAELMACREGLDLALHRTGLPIMVEFDCAQAILMLNTSHGYRSPYRTLVCDIQLLISENPWEISITHIRRTQNKVSHSLTAYGPSTPRTAIWFGTGTNEVVNLCMAEKLP